MTKRPQNQNKVANQPCFEFIFGADVANDEQTIQKSDKKEDEIDYKNTLEVKELSGGALAKFREKYNVEFINGKYLIRW